MMVIGKGGLLKTMAMFGICVRFLVCKISQKKLEDSLAHPTNIYIVKHLSSVTTSQVTSRPYPSKRETLETHGLKMTQGHVSSGRYFGQFPLETPGKNIKSNLQNQSRSISFRFSDGTKGQLKAASRIETAVANILPSS